ncbi:MAG: response regulator [Candidatus Adiutrix sp.]|jgi:signal transduction histidine kinase/CheY-like chemotaxis protein/HAMP domain-containing protein|nr:response regulator [Candidatus Adiutrix sp.]
MSSKKGSLKYAIAKYLNEIGLGMRAQLIIIFLLVKVIPLILLAMIAWRQFTNQGDVLRDIAVSDSAAALNDSAVENIERMSTDTAWRVAEFLYERDDDLRYVAGLAPTEENYLKFVTSAVGRVGKKGRWELAPDGQSWILAEQPPHLGFQGQSTNKENDDMDGFHPRGPYDFESETIPLYDEIAFIDLQGNEIVKIATPGSPKVHYPISPEKKNISQKENTYVKAENYFEELKSLKPGEIYVSDVIGAYVGSNYIGMYAPEVLAKVSADRGYDIEYKPGEQAYAGRENPNGRRFEGIVRWAAPVTDDHGQITGYVTLALNHDHIMEFVDHLTPMYERYTQIPSAFEGNYAFIWDYKCRNVAHPRHHSIVGFDPETGDPQVPWLETSIYEGWQASGLKKWTDYLKDYPLFHEQSRDKKPAPALTRAGLVGLDGRYLNNAPQCTGWMDLTAGGGSGSFYILWSGLYKLNTAAAIPYYTGRYAPSEANDFSRRGFGFVAIGSEREYFTAPAQETAKKLTQAVNENLAGTFMQLTTATTILIVVVIFIAFWMASFLTKRITDLIKGIYRFRSGERQFRFEAPIKDEFGTLADSFDEMADSIADSVKNPLTIIDLNRNIIYMNEYGLSLCKKDLPDIIGKPYGEYSVFPPNSPYCPITSLIEGREAAIYYVEERGRYIRGVANYFRSKTGAQIGYLVEVVDVSDMVFKQKDLEKAMNEANRANEHKGEFLARMSHEIRTPMNAIIGLANVMLKNIDDLGDGLSQELVEVKDNLRQIEASSQHLLGLLNDILDISKIEAGKITLAAETLVLSKLTDTVLSIIRPRCDEKHITFDTAIEGFSPDTFLGDSLRLRQVLINLLGNAVKFTPELGRIRFTVARKDRKDGRTLVEFIIQDTGIGISQKDLATIFQPFEQANGKINRQFGGTGLGLAISRHIVNILGGDITVNSLEGEGSEFSFSLWLRETEANLPEEAAITDPTDKFVGKRVLLVDDVDLNRKVAKAMLKRTGIAIDEADDGLEAVKKFEESAENTYDIVLMDIMMPNLDGYQASLAIRALDREDARRVPIVALTANAFQDDIEKALQSGMNTHIAKPVKMDKLVEVLYKMLMEK